MPDSEQIRGVLGQHPELTTVEDVIDRCQAEGIEVGFWSVYFAARDAGRKLTRRESKPSSASELRDLALIFFGLHKGMKQALETFDKLEDMNKVGTRVDWEREIASTQYGWELSVAQELADRAGSILQARQLLRKL